MNNVTLSIAIVASILVFMLKPDKCLVLFLVSFVLYPTFLTFPLGTVDLTVRRVVILVILALVIGFTKLKGEEEEKEEGESYY